MTLMKMKDICLKIGSGATPRGGKEAYIDSGISLIRSQNVLDFSFSYDGLAHITEEQAAKLSNVIVENGDVLLNITGDSVARACMVDEEALPARVNQHVAIIRANRNVVLGSFILYSFQLSKPYLLKLASGGATRNALTKGMIEELEIEVPSLREQERIVTLIDDIQHKIENNKCINQNLAKQAQVLYQKLCDDCTSNNLISLAEIMDYSGGSQPPASEFIFEEQPGYIRFVQIRDYDTDSHITYIPESSRNKLCEEHDIMIARYGASLGRICAGINGAYNVALAKVYPKKPYYREFLRCYLSSHSFYEGINNKGGRSAQAGFNQSDIKSFELSVPTQQQLQSFEDTASLLFEERLSLNRENRKLATLRDTLLPKLMSGELDVSGIDL